jgi:chromosome segregation ATPase
MSTIVTSTNITSQNTNVDIDDCLKKILEESLMRITVLGMENERLNFELSESKKRQMTGNSELHISMSQSQLFVKDKDRQLEILNASLNDKNHTIDALRQKLNITEQEILHMGVIDNENRALKAKLSSFEMHISQLDIEKETQFKEILRLREFEKQTSLLSGRIIDFESRVTFITRENDKLNLLLVERAKEVQNWQGRLSDANSAASRVPDLENKIRLLVIENERLERELESYQTKYNDNEKRLCQLPEQENRIRLLATENERLQTILTDYCNKFNEFEHKASMATDLEARLKSMQGENERLQHFLTELQTRLHDAEGRAGLCPGLEDKIRLLVSENERLQALLADLQRRYEDAEASQRKVLELETRIRMIQSENDRLSQALVDMKDQLSTMTMAYQTEQSRAMNLPVLEDKIRLLVTENERLQGFLTELKKQMDDMRNKNNDLEARLYQIVTLEQEIKVLRGRCGDLENHSKTIIIERDSYLVDLSGIREKEKNTGMHMSQRQSEYDVNLAERDNRINSYEVELNRLRNLLKDTEGRLYDLSKLNARLPDCDAKI